MPAYYNDNDRNCVAWLKALIAEGHLPQGDVDDRPIQEVRASDLAGYGQCHFFAGIGGWAYALQLAEWPDDRPVWTGSCPCQPFSVAGKRRGVADERHLWPEFARLIRDGAPPTVFGEQVASKDGRLWLAGVRSDLEGMGYGVGAADLCAAGVGAPHIRQRLWWVADARSLLGEWGQSIIQPNGKNSPKWHAEGIDHQRGRADGWLALPNGRLPGDPRIQRGGEHGFEPEDGRTGGMAHSLGPRLEEREGQPGHAGSECTPVERDCDAGGVADTQCDPGDERRFAGESNKGTGTPGAGPYLESGRPSDLGFWSLYSPIPCLDGKSRRIEPGTFPLAHGLPARVGRLRGYGNAIVPQVAAEFVMAFREAEREL